MKLFVATLALINIGYWMWTQWYATPPGRVPVPAGTGGPCRLPPGTDAVDYRPRCKTQEACAQQTGQAQETGRRHTTPVVLSHRPVCIPAHRHRGPRPSGQCRRRGRATRGRRRPDQLPRLYPTAGVRERGQGHAQEADQTGFYGPCPHHRRPGTASCHFPGCVQDRGQCQHAYAQTQEKGYQGQALYVAPHYGQVLAGCEIRAGPERCPARPLGGR